MKTLSYILSFLFAISVTSFASAATTDYAVSTPAEETITVKVKGVS